MKKEFIILFLYHLHFWVANYASLNPFSAVIKRLQFNIPRKEVLPVFFRLTVRCLFKKITNVFLWFQTICFSSLNKREHKAGTSGSFSAIVELPIISADCERPDSNCLTFIVIRSKFGAVQILLESIPLIERITDSFSEFWVRPYFRLDFNHPVFKLFKYRDKCDDGIFC